MCAILNSLRAPWLLATEQSHVFTQHLHQRRNILAPLAQRWHADRQHIEAVKQVFAKVAFAHQFAQITRGGGNHPRIKRKQLVGAQRLNSRFLQGAQQLSLQAQGQVANLIKKQRATVGQQKFAIAPLAVGAGLGARCDAKKIGLQQGVGYGRYIQVINGPSALADVA